MYFLSINRFKQENAPSDVGRIIAEHIEWTQRQIDEGRIVQAGKWGEAGGMAVIKAADLAGAEDLLKDDPLISSGLVVCETARLYPDVPFDEHDEEYERKKT